MSSQSIVYLSLLKKKMFNFLKFLKYYEMAFLLVLKCWAIVTPPAPSFPRLCRFRLRHFAAWLTSCQKRGRKEAQKRNWKDAKALNRGRNPRYRLPSGCCRRKKGGTLYLSLYLTASLLVSPSLSLSVNLQAAVKEKGGTPYLSVHLSACLVVSLSTSPRNS